MVANQGTDMICSSVEIGSTSATEVSSEVMTESLLIAPPPPPQTPSVCLFVPMKTFCLCKRDLRQVGDLEQ